MAGRTDILDERDPLAMPVAGLVVDPFLARRPGRFLAGFG